VKSGAIGTALSLNCRWDRQSFPAGWGSRTSKRTLLLKSNIVCSPQAKPFKWWWGRRCSMWCTTEMRTHSVFEFVNPILIHFLFPFTHDFKHMEDHNAIHLGLSAGNKQYVYIKW